MVRVSVSPSRVPAGCRASSSARSRLIWCAWKSIEKPLGDPALPLNFGARPLRLSARNDGDGLRLGLSGTPGKTYRVELSEQIDPAAWRPLRAITTDAAGNADFTQTLPAGPEPQFFRAVPAP